MASDLKKTVIERHANLAGQTALVTGGTKGIGRACVEELAALGAKVLTCSRTQADLDKSCSEWQAQGLDVQGFAADLSSSEGLDVLLEKAKEVFGGKLNILVNNAGTNVRGATQDFAPEDFRKVMATNLDSAFLLSQKCYPLLKASQNASVVMISSMAGGPATINSGAPYAMTKAALDQLTKYLACEWAKDKIRVNSVKPGYIKTPLTEHILKDQKRMGLILSVTPMRRIAEPQEISGLVAFLCSQAASFMTGQCILADGGIMCNGMWPFEDVIPFPSHYQGNTSYS